MNRRRFLSRLLCLPAFAAVADSTRGGDPEEYRCVIVKPIKGTILRSKTYYAIVDLEDVVIIENYSEYLQHSE